ncbi:tRNA dimethylallyltransferase [Candidatus Falkowbacteria bacterium]|nr:tRNA dimethylallyltransferase [Candidatus Falkowbacteria bacterium]
MKNNNQLIVILGPTACGKTKLAARLAAKYNGEIVSADSRQVYRDMDIGTGKDLKDYVVKIASPAFAGVSYPRNGKVKIPYHLINVVSPMTDFNAAKYQKLAYRAIDDIFKKGKTPFLVGGTGLYIDAVIKGYQLSQIQNPNDKCQKIRKKLDKLSLKQLLARLQKIDAATYEIVDKNNRRRVQRALEIYYETGMPKSKLPENKKPLYDILILGVKFPLKKIYKKIDSRLESWFKEGMINEVKKLRKGGVSWKRLENFGLEYRWVARYLRQKINRDGGKTILSRNFGLFERDKEGQRNDLSRSRGYGESHFAPARRSRSQKGQIAAKIVLPPSHYEELVAALKKAIHHFAKRQLTWFKKNEEIIWIENYHQAEKQIKRFLKK